VPDGLCRVCWATVREAGGDLVEDARVFDVYEGA